MVVIFCSKLVLLTVNGKWRRANFLTMYALRKIGGDFRRVLARRSSYALIGWSGPGKVSVTEEVVTAPQCCVHVYLPPSSSL